MSNKLVIGSHDHFMNVAFSNAFKSDDPNTKVGVCIVNEDGMIVGQGYNRAPGAGFSIPWNQAHKTDEEWLNSKYPYVLHAEMDAILNKTCSSLKECTLYTLIFPWNECAKLIVESGIKKVVYYSDKYYNGKHTVASKNLFNLASVVYENFVPESENNLQIFQEKATQTVNFGCNKQLVFNN